MIWSRISDPRSLESLLHQKIQGIIAHSGVIGSCTIIRVILNQRNAPIFETVEKLQIMMSAPYGNEVYSKHFFLALTPPGEEAPRPRYHPAPTTTQILRNRPPKYLTYLAMNANIGNGLEYITLNFSIFILRYTHKS